MRATDPLYTPLHGLRRALMLTALMLTALAAYACREPKDKVERRGATPVGRDAATSQEDGGTRPSEGPTPAPLTGSDAADVFALPQCPALGFEYAQGCENCPSRALACPCNAYSEASGSDTTEFQLGCSYGTCLVNVSCEIYCASVLERRTESFLFAPVCPSERSCAASSECGDGFCYGETALKRGDCVTGADGTECLDASDCRGGFCGPRGCTSGQSGALCASEADCAAGKCVGDVPLDGFGFCSSGQDSEKCVNDQDCAPELFCHTGSTRCMDGELGGACQKNEQCKSGSCVFGGCRTGELGTDCDDDADCDSGRCNRPEGLKVPGTCITGEAGDNCYFDDDCQSGHCLSLAYNEEGTCTDRAVDAPCFAATDCESGSCTERSQQPSSACEQTTDAGVSCDATGLCVGDGTCSTRTCD